MGLVCAKDALRDALKNRYTLTAFNFFNFDMLRAILDGAEAEQSPVIVQISMGGRAFMKSFPRLVQLVNLYCEDYSVPIVFNHDHCPTIEDARYAVDCGMKSVMFDGSHLPFAENVRLTREITDYAHARGAAVEAELGAIAGFEDTIFSESTVFTDPEQAKTFVEQTGCDSLAVSVGTAHGGVPSEQHLPLHLDRLRAIAEAIPEQPLVLHGAASLPQPLIDEVNRWGGNVPTLKICSEEDISKCAAFHVCKANMDVDNFLVYTAELRRLLTTKPEAYMPRKMLQSARDAVRDEVRHKLRNVVHSAGRSWL